MSEFKLPYATELQNSILTKHVSIIGHILRQLGQSQINLNYMACNQPVPYETHGLPYSLIFNTLPKSGSRYVVNTMVQWLQIFSDRLTSGVFPDCQVMREQAALHAQVPTILQDHFSARMGNLRTVGDFFDRVVIHVRDPRQSMISWLHHVDKLYAEGKHSQLYFTNEELPEGYHDFSFEKKVDTQIDLYYTQALTWIEGWLDAAENTKAHGLNIKFTQFRKLKLDEEGFFKDLFEFWQMDPKLAEGRTRKADTEKDHMRAGKLNEWMGVLSPVQRERVCQMMSDRLAHRFEWMNDLKDVDRAIADGQVDRIAA